MEITIADRATVEHLLRRPDLAAKKSLGQNFLVDPVIIEKIIDIVQIGTDDIIIEIGPGLGGMSQFIAKKASSLTLLEIDRRFCHWLEQLFAEQRHVSIINDDAVKFNFAEYAQTNGWNEYQVIANLPYCATSTIIKNLLLKGGCWTTLTLMVQKEVAQKLMPALGSPLNLLIAYYADIETVLAVPRTSFVPVPAIESAVIRLTHHIPPVTVADQQAFFKLITTAFTMKRKTLLNVLGGNEKQRWRQIFNAAAIDGERRAETLSLEEFARLFKAI